MTTNMRYTRHDTVKFLHIEGMTMTATETLGDEDGSQLIPEQALKAKSVPPGRGPLQSNHHRLQLKWMVLSRSQFLTRFWRTQTLSGVATWLGTSSVTLITLAPFMLL